MQQYSVTLEDHGITSFLTNGTESHLLDPSESLNNSDNFNGPFSVHSSDTDLSNIKGRKTNKRKILQNEFLINTEGQNYINISVLHLELPGPIHLEETKGLIQFSKGNPALCAQVKVGTINNDSSSSTSTTTWNSIHFSSNYSPYIIINKNTFHSETNNRYIELSNCKPLSWDHYTEIPITLQNNFHFRARYCIYGYSTMCTEYIKPIKVAVQFEDYKPWQQGFTMIYPLARNNQFLMNVLYLLPLISLAILMSFQRELIRDYVVNLI
ncbi:unnamed protein product [Schistosoma mattheei]|uniref:Uncharacterized protein n=1 Tax=Schistosoma mattheei TaxID=31246 RepID=A0A183NUG6_9TREM|nr:unnamed protein product [Schistosoma mattheei]